MSLYNRNTGSPLRDKSFQLAVEIVQLSKYIRSEKREFSLSDQILRSGTNPGAMSREAQYAESSRDFIHKLAIAQKELCETIYWLDLLLETNIISKDQYVPIRDLAHEVRRLLAHSIKRRSGKRG